MRNFYSGRIIALLGYSANLDAGAFWHKAEH